MLQLKLLDHPCRDCPRQRYLGAVHFFLFEADGGIQGLTVWGAFIYQESDAGQMYRVSLFLRSKNQPLGNPPSAIMMMIIINNLRAKLRINEQNNELIWIFPSFCRLYLQ